MCCLRSFNRKLVFLPLARNRVNLALTEYSVTAEDSYTDLAVIAVKTFCIERNVIVFPCFNGNAVEKAPVLRSAELWIIDNYRRKTKFVSLSLRPEKAEQTLCLFCLFLFKRLL